MNTIKLPPLDVVKDMITTHELQSFVLLLVVVVVWWSCWCVGGWVGGSTKQ